METNDKNEYMVSYHVALNTLEGYFERLFHSPLSEEFFKARFYLWAPWTLEYVLSRNGFEKIISKAVRANYYVTTARKA